jgi:ubiquitin fusion degradation protein 1
MMRNLLLSEGDMIQVEYVNLEIGKFVKLQPQSVDFLEISNPKAVYLFLFNLFLFFIVLILNNF